MQAAHAALDFAVTHPRLTGRWHAASGTLVLLAAPGELALGWLLADCQAAGLAAVPFYEPDLGGALTAVAAGPASRLACKFPLALGGR